MPSLPENKKLVSISQAALLLGVSVDTVRRWDKKGIIKSVRGKANKRFFTIKDLEQIKLSKPLTISEAAERLRVSQSTLMRIEEKGYIKSSRDRSGRRGYSEETIQTFLNSDFFPKTKPIPVKINLPLQAMEKLIAGNSLDGTHKEKVTNVEEAEKLLVENEKQISELSNLLLLDRKRAGIMSTFQRMFQSVLIAIVALSISTVIVIMVFFLYVPDKTADFFGYTNQSPLSALPINNLTHMSKSSAVLGTSSFNTEHNVFANVLKPFSKVSLLLVKQINKKTYKKIIPQEKIEDINDVLTLDSEGRIVPVVGIHVPDSSYIKISNDGSNKDLSDYVKEKVVIANEQGQIPVQQRNTGQVVTEQSLINPVIQPLEDGSVTSLKIADGSVTADKLAPGISVLGDGSIAGKNIKDGEISSNKIIDKTIIDADIADTAGIADSKFAQITSVNKVAGSAVQVAGGGGLTNNSGLSLLTSCNTNEILSWNGTAWVCTANIGGGSGVASVNSLNGVISIVGGGINSISTAGSSITVTGTEADTLAAVTGRGAATTTAVALNGGITSTSSTPLTLSSTNPVISIGNTGSLSVTDGNNILFSLADNGTTGNLLVTGTVNGATISGGSLTASAVNGVTTANILLNTGSYADPSWITSLAKSKVGLGNVENTALSTWAGSSNVTTTGTLTGGATGTGFTLNLGASTLSGNIGGPNIDESTLAGLTTSNFSSADISQWTNNSGYLTTVDVSSNTNLSASDGVTLTEDSISNTDKGSSQNIFKTVAVSGQSNVISDSNADTVTLVAGANVTLTTDASTDTITIDAAGSGGGSTYLAGTDLDLTGSTFSLETTLDSVDTINLAGTGTLNGLDVIDATSESTIEGAIDTLANLTSASTLATVGTLTGGATGAGFTLDFGSSTLSGNIGGSNIDESTLAGLTTSNFASANISQWTNNAGFITDGNTGWDNSYGFITASSSETLTNKTIAAGSNIITGITASNLTAGDFSSVINTGTYSIDVSGNAGTVTNGVYTTGSYVNPAWITSLAGSKVSGNISGNAATATLAANATDAVHAAYADTAGVASTSADLICTGCIGGTEIDESMLAGLTTSNFGNANISQWTNNAGYIVDGNSGWDNSYGFITASSADTLTNKAGNISQWTNDSGYLTSADISSNTNLSASDGVTLTGDALTNSDKGSSQNVFKTVAVSGQSNVVTDSNSDTLTLVAGSNVTLTTDASTDTITIDATGGGSTYSAGADLDLTGTTFSLETTIDSVDTINLAGTGTLNGLDAIDATSESTIEGAIDTLANLTTASSLTTVGTLTGGATGAGFTLNFGTSTLSGNIGGSNIDESTLAGITASNLTAGDFSSVITSGTYSIDISGNAATATTATTATTAGLATNATDAVHAAYADTATTSADLTCANCIGGDEIDESLLTLTKSQVGLSNVEDTALSTWAGSANITTTGTLTSGATGAGFTLNLGASTLSGNIGGSNIDESTLAGLTTSNFSSANISQWTNNAGFITDGNTGWDNSYGFITASGSDSLTNKTIAAGSNTITGITASNLTAGDFSSVITSGTYAIDVSGNAATATNANTVTNGIYTTGSYANPAWITSIAGSKVSGNISGNAATATLAINATDAVHANYADVAGTATTSADLTCINCIGGTEIDESALGGLTTSNFASANISQWTNNSGFITDGNTSWDNSYGFITASSSDTLTNKTIAAGSNTISDLTASNLTAGDFSSVITSGTYSIDISGNAATATSATSATNATTVTNGVYTTGSYSNPAWITALAGSKISGNISGNAATATLATNATDAVHANYADVAGTATTSADLICTNCIGGTEIDESALTLTKSQVGLGDVENTALSTWAGTSNITTTGTLTGGATGAGFTLNLGTSTLSGNVTGSNIDESTLAGLTTSNFSSANISQWTNNSGYIIDGNTGWDNSYGYITAASSDTLTNKTIAAGTNTITGITASNLTAGDYSSVITSGTYSIDISGNAATASNANTVTNGVYTTGSYSNPAWITAIAGSKITGNISGNAATATNATDSVHADYADVAGTATTSADLICTNCIGGTEIDESALTLTKSQVGLGNVENTALSTWSGTSNITTTGTLTGGATGAGFTLNFGTSTLSGDISGSNIDESTLAGLTTSNFSSANISQWTNNSGFINDGNSGWDNSYGFITASSSDTLTNKTIAAGSNTISGITASNLTAGDFSSVITSGTYAIDVSGNATTATNATTVTNGIYTTGSYANPAWITSLAGSKVSGDISGNAATASLAVNATDAVHATYADTAGVATISADLTCANCVGGNEIDESALTLTKSQVGLSNVENTALSTWGGTSNITTTGTLTGGATGAGFTLDFGTSTLSGDIGGSNIDESTLAGLTTSNFSSADISQWTNNAGYISDGNTNWDNSYGFITASGSDSLTNKTIAAGSNTITGITASNLTAGDFSSKITSGTYSIGISGNAATATLAVNATDAVHATYADTAGVATISADLTCTNCIGGTEIDESALTLTKSQVGLSNVENTALSTWAGTSSITTTGTLTSGGTGAGFTLNFGTSILSGDIGGSNIDESTLSGLTASNFTAGDFSSKITSGTYSIGISGTAATASDLTCANCIGGTEIDESAFGAITGTSLNAGSGAIITSGTIGTASTTTFTGAGGTFSGALAANGGITFDNAADTLSAFTLAGTLNSNANLILNIGNAGTDFLSNGGLTLANALTVTTGGITLSAGALAVNSDSITADGATLTINAAGNVDVQDALNADSITSDAGVSIAAGQSYTGAGAVTLSSGAAAGLTLDSASGTITFSDALGIGTNNIVTGATTIASTELDRLDGKDAALVDQNDFTSADGAGGTSSGSGLEAGTGGIGLLQGCSDGQVLKWNDASSVWECGTDRGSFHNIMNGNYTNNSTTFTDVDNNSDASDKIGFPIGANEEWIFFMNVQLQTNATADQKWQVTAPAGATCDISVANVEQTVSVSNIACGTSSGTIAADTATNNIFITGSIINSSTAGNAQLQFGQTVTSGTSTIHLGSYVNAYRVDGADLAEVYYATNAADLRPGTVLAMDSSIEAGVKKSEASYDKQLVGIVTTKPGLVIGKASSVTGQPVMVALSGRVPVKVNTENGAIEPGDYLTSSSIPGVAMKATKAGAIIGQAMTGYATGGSGQVIAFIKTGFSQGASISSLVPGLSDTKSDVDRGKVTLEYFLQNKQLHGESVGLSEITTDKLTAGFEIITSKVVADELLINSIKPATGQDIALQLTSEGRFIVKDEDGNEAITFDSKGNAFFAGTVTADKIKANQIEGLEFLVSSMRNEVLSASTASAQPSASPSSVIANSATQNEALPAGRQESSSITNSNGTLNLSSLTVDGLATISANLRVKNSALIEGILNVVDTLTTNNLIVSKAADFFGNVIFHGDVAFQGRPTFNKDTAGVAFIRKGENKVEVQFAKEYDQAPVVSANIILDQITKTPDQSDEDQENMQKNIEEKLFASNVKYVITRRTTKGFVILLDKPLDEDATFSWTALNTN